MSDLVMEFSKTAARLGSAAKHDHSGIWHMESLPDGLWDAFGQSGLLGLSAPVAFGGAGLSVEQIARVARQFSKATGVQGLSTVWQSHNLMADWIFGHFANTAQQAEWWPKIAMGAATASFAVSEAGAGAHPKKLSTRAVQEGDGWRLDGGKAYVTNGPIATVFVVVAVVGETSGRKRFGAFLVPRNAEGLTVRSSEHVEYLKPSGHASLDIAGVYVPDTARLTDADDVYPIMVKPLRDHEDAAGAWSRLGAYEGLATAFARNQDTVIIGGGIAARLHAIELMLNDGSEGESLLAVRAIFQDIRREVSAALDRFPDALGEADRVLASDLNKLGDIARYAVDARFKALGQSLADCDSGA